MGWKAFVTKKNEGSAGWRAEDDDRLPYPYVETVRIFHNKREFTIFTLEILMDSIRNIESI